jgi:hypothetical protein
LCFPVIKRKVEIYGKKIIKLVKELVKYFPYCDVISGLICDVIFRSMSVSRGLQVEEDDLIQFSDGQPGGAKKSGVANNKAGLKSEELEELREGEDDEDLV